MVFIWILCSFFPFKVGAGSKPAHEALLKVNPTQLFVKEDRDLVFEAKVPVEKKQNVNLAEINSTTQIVKFHWAMNDEGILGDLKKGDGIFSRKVEFKEKRPQTLMFGIYFGNDVPAKIEDKTRTAEVSIIQRPNFIELVKQTFSKIM